ncbi:DUF624 domain-containing protein [Arthrobacter sp. JZ12]|uniref:DUF624 domain-containing protein n=1 Tax=Arthrobacter sp. JZ12 TaxID=2654190 RepID=UPI002B4A6956|nr:DUF624 domain-containing protein [Arthrobacter sp. JZ12]WRH23903.1 DUF624 domain-containing protein [Arthrobacter sp. JZ12]
MSSLLRPARSGQPARRRGAGLGFETFSSIFAFVYTFLAVNVSLAVTNAPLVFFLYAVVEPAASWPFFLALSVTVLPSLGGAFAAFADLRGEESVDRPFAAFFRGYRAAFRRAALAGLAAVVVLFVLGVDLALVAGQPAGVLLAPLAVLGIVAVVVCAVHLVAGAVLLPSARLRDLAKAALFISVRRWYLSAAALVLLGIVAGAALVQPVLGVALVPAPLLFIVWSNAAYAFGAELERA